jgi:hypothetical protein
MAAVAPLGFLVFAAFVGVATVRAESRALAGGLLVAFCLWWVYFIWRAVDRYAALDRQPTGSCSISGTEEQLVLAGSIALLGILLIALQLRSERVRP